MKPLRARLSAHTDVGGRLRKLLKQAKQQSGAGPADTAAKDSMGVGARSRPANVISVQARLAAAEVTLKEQGLAMGKLRAAVHELRLELRSRRWVGGDTGHNHAW